MIFFDKMKDFNEVYQKLYIECKEELEMQKRKTKNQRAKYIVILLLGGVIMYIVLLILDNMGYMNDKESRTIFISICIIIVLYLYIWGASYTKEHETYNRIFKEKVIQNMVKSYSKNLNYKYRVGISISKYIDAEFESFDQFKSEDGISGILEDRFNINFSEVHTKIKQKTKNGKINYVTAFHGLFAEFEIDKYVAETIKIRKNTIKIFDSNDRLEMDSGEFEKTYDIYSKNKIEAMQIFTSDVLQLFIDFKDLNPEVTLKNNKIYIRFETGDVFEPSMSKDALEYELLKKYYYMIGFILYFSKEIYKKLP